MDGSRQGQRPTLTAGTDIWSVGWSAEEPLPQGLGLPPSRRRSSTLDSRSSLRASQRLTKPEVRLSTDPLTVQRIEEALKKDVEQRRHRFSIALEQAQKIQEITGYASNSSYVNFTDEASDGDSFSFARRDSYCNIQSSPRSNQTTLFANASGDQKGSSVGDRGRFSFVRSSGAERYLPTMRAHG